LRAVLFIFLFFFSFSARAKEKIQIIFYELKPIAGFDGGKAKVLENLMLGELYNYEEFEFLSREDVKKIVDDEEFDKMMECDSKTCILEVSGAMGIDYLMNGEIGNVGKKNSILNLQILDSVNGKVLSRVYARINNLSEDETINAVIKSTHSLIENFSKKNSKLQVKETKTKKKKPKAKLKKDKKVKLKSKVREKDDALVLDFSKMLEEDQNKKPKIIKTETQENQTEISEESFWNTSNILILTTTAVLAGVFTYGMIIPDSPKKPSKYPNGFSQADGERYNSKLKDYNTELDQKYLYQTIGGVGMGLGLGTLVLINF